MQVSEWQKTERRAEGGTSARRSVARRADLRPRASFRLPRRIRHTVCCRALSARHPGSAKAKRFNPYSTCAPGANAAFEGPSVARCQTGQVELPDF